MEIDEESGGTKGGLGGKKAMGVSASGGGQRSKLPEFQKDLESDIEGAGSGKTVAQQSGGALCGGENIMSRELQLRERARLGGWRVHEELGACICDQTANNPPDSDSENDNEEGEMAKCEICQRCVVHLQASRQAKDQVLEAGLELRDITVASKHGDADAAYMRGELEMTQTMLAAVHNKVKELYVRMGELQAEVAVAKDEAARERRSADDYADRLAECCDELADVKDELQGEIS
ncbi:hypothetical protein K438DRAFT_1999058 [Mycena galopus ATCC 62051]|nr:hypothetical protein K438DRAFT_1999058 [Mycena galopus ATCC 62051]